MKSLSMADGQPSTAYFRGKKNGRPKQMTDVAQRRRLSEPHDADFGATRTALEDQANIDIVRPYRNNRADANAKYQRW